MSIFFEILMSLTFASFCISIVASNIKIRLFAFTVVEDYGERDEEERHGRDCFRLEDVHRLTGVILLAEQEVTRRLAAAVSNLPTTAAAWSRFFAETVGGKLLAAEETHLQLQEMVLDLQDKLQSLEHEKKSNLSALEKGIAKLERENARWELQLTSVMREKAEAEKTLSAEIERRGREMAKLQDQNVRLFTAVRDTNLVVANWADGIWGPVDIRTSRATTGTVLMRYPEEQDADPSEDAEGDVEGDVVVEVVRQQEDDVTSDCSKLRETLAKVSEKLSEERLRWREAEERVQDCEELEANLTAMTGPAMGVASGSETPRRARGKGSRVWDEATGYSGDEASENKAGEAA
eukprot:g18212.t1